MSLGGLEQWGGGGGEQSREMLHCSSLICCSYSPFRGVGCIKGAKGEIKVNQEQREQAVFLLGDTALLFLACLIVLNIFHLNVWAREEMMCERHERKSLTVELLQ